MADLVASHASRELRGWGRILDPVCKAFAVLSGLILIAMALMSLWSIAGRALWGKALVGDYELVQYMTAVAVALSLPYANWIGGHVIVDFFTAKARARTNALLDLLAYWVMAFFSFLIAWRLAVGMLDLRATHDASMLLGIPTWWAYAPMVPSFVLLGLTALYAAHDNLRKCRS